VSDRQDFSAPTLAGDLCGWVAGGGSPVLVLHGGPGLGYEYMDPVCDELRSDFQVATFQQRGLAPSTVQGPFTMTQAITDVVAVIDALGWARAFVVGHSWGGHLALRFTAAHPERVLGTLAVESPGLVGDGGVAAFEAELLARVRWDKRERLQVLAEREEAGDATEQDSLEAHAITWPGYFADPEQAPPMPPMRFSNEAFGPLVAAMTEDAPEVANALTVTPVRYTVLAGGASPIPWGQAARTVSDLSATATLTVVPSAGHFVWHEAPGCIRHALRVLARDPPA
jgi:pimeloyl-ACP methyl ester carboxylesterase